MYESSLHNKKNILIQKSLSLPVLQLQLLFSAIVESFASSKSFKYMMD